MNRKKQLKGLILLNSSTELSIDNIITLNRLKNIFVTKEDFESFRNDQNNRLGCTQKAVADLKGLISKLLEIKESEKIAKREAAR